MTEQVVINILNNFLIQGNVQRIEIISSGHINETYKVCTDREEYIFQRINDEVFKDPIAVMENIYNVTEFLKAKIIQNYGNSEREVINIIKTKEGELLYKNEYGYFRVYLFVKDGICLEKAETYIELYQSGYTFGKFTELLSDFPVYKLHETIKDFHNFKVRFEKLRQVANEDRLDRFKNVAEEVAFIYERENYIHHIDYLIREKRVPIRVVHNDAKLTNIMFDKDNREGICILDLDTVMPGTLLFDFGDSIRYGAATAIEDERNTERMGIDITAFTEYSKGYLKACRNSITENEKNELVFAAKIMTLEFAMRALTDYLEGDIYYKIDYTTHNIIRAKAQIKLLSEIEKKEQELTNIIAAL